MKKLFILVAALVLLLCACGTPAGPSTNLSDFVTAFDLSDLSRYLTEEQLEALDGALRENLSMAHGIDNYALYYDDPPEGSVKFPFDNAGGLSLANLDIEKLAERITGQIATELEGKGDPVIAATSVGSIATTTTTTKPSTTTTGSTTTTTKTNVTTTTKTTGYTPPDQYVIGGNLSRDRIVTAGFLQEKTTANSGKLIPIETEWGDFLVEKKHNSSDNFNSEGLTLYIYRSPKKDGIYDLIGTIGMKSTKPDERCNISLVLDPNAKSFTGNLGRAIKFDAQFGLGSPKMVSDGLDYYSAKNVGDKATTTLERDDIAVFQFNGQTMVKISP